MKNIVLTSLSIFLLYGCGFTPIYGENQQSASVTDHLNQIDITIIPDRDGQFLRNALIDQFYQTGYPNNPKYRLITDPVREQISDFDITIDSEATRRQLTLTTDIKLVNIQTNDVLLKRKLLAITSHNVLQSEFSTLVTEQSARESALNDLARQIEQQIALYLSR